MTDKIPMQTKSVCPVCLKEIPGLFEENEHGVWLTKECPAHGRYSLLISRHAHYHRELREYYFSVIKDTFRQGRYLFFITGSCNLECPICFYGNDPFGEISAPETEELLRKNRKIELVIFGKEPTCSKDLFEIIKTTKKFQSPLSLYTNGLRIGNKEYLQELKKSGVTKIYLQFDGFEQGLYDTFRNSSLLETKIRALDNLKEAGMDTVINMAVADGVNKNQLIPVLEYAVKNSFVKTINFTCYIRTGKGKRYLNDAAMMPDQLIDAIGEETQGKIARREVFLFQKLLYAYMSFFKKRTCFYIQYFWIYREKNGYCSIGKFIDLEALEKVLDTYKEMMKKNTFLARSYILLFLPPRLLRFKSLKVMLIFLRMSFFHMCGIKDYSNASARFLQLIFSTACDSYKADLALVKKCHIGIIYKDRDGVIKKIDENGSYLLKKESEHACCPG